MRPTRSKFAAPLVLLMLVATAPVTRAQEMPKRALRASDLYRIRSVGDPQLSPDGAWVAYTVTAADSAKDKSDTDIWMSSFDGAQTVRLTASPEIESSPRWAQRAHGRRSAGATPDHRTLDRDAARPVRAPAPGGARRGSVVAQ